MGSRRAPWRACSVSGLSVTLEPQEICRVHYHPPLLYWDDRVPGLALRLSRRHKTFIVRYRLEGAQKRYTLGRYPALTLAEARQKAKAALGRVAEGQAPKTTALASREGQGELFGVVARDYIEKYAKPNTREESCVETAAYPPEISGLDTNCRSGVHSFWMPATNRAFPEWAFFRRHNTKTRELRRHAINPNDYRMDDEEPSLVWLAVPERETKATREQVEAVMDPVRTMKSGREVPWRNAGLKLYSLGLTIDEIESEWRPWCPDRQSRKKLAGVIRLLKKNESSRSAKQFSAD